MSATWAVTLPVTADTFTARLLCTLSLRCRVEKIKVRTIQKKIITLMAGVKKKKTLWVIQIFKMSHRH